MSESRPLPFRPRDYTADHAVDWCPGCGDFGVLRALERALAELGRDPAQVAVFGGIGCSGKTPYYLHTYGVHTLHGRVLPYAAGAKLADPGLTVIAIGGDGDGLSIGGGHFINAGRRNLDLTYLLYNNGVYGLTKGQGAPTLARGEQTRSMPSPTIQGALDPVSLALVSGYGWVGRGYAYAIAELATLMAAAIRYPGLAMLEILQPCPMYNDLFTREWFEGKDRTPPAPRITDLATTSHVSEVAADATTEQAVALRSAALARATATAATLPVGCFLADHHLPSFAHDLCQLQPAYGQTPPARHPVTTADGAPALELGALLDALQL